MSAPLGRLSESEKGDITALLEKTRFTRDELLDFYKYSKGPPLVDGTLDKEHYVSLCDAHGLSGRSLQSRLWDVLDVSDDGSVTIQELILVLNSLTRGKLEDVTQVFFNIYDVNHDGSIDIEELMEVYADLIEVGKGIKATSLNDAQKERLQKFVNEADANSDQDLDYAEFAAAVKKLSTIDHEKPSLLSARTVLLVIITSFFELGTSFAQAAMGALALQLQHRFRDEETGELMSDNNIGNLVGWYFAGAMVGPLIGGQLLLRIGAIKTIVIANVIVCIFVLGQTLADGEDQLWMLTVSRFGIGFGGMITPFCTLEVLLQLFPDDFMLMAGIRNLVQSGSGFASFVILPAIQRSFIDGSEVIPMDARGSGSGDALHPDYNTGTTWALAFCMWCGIASLLSNVIIWVFFLKDADLPPPTTLASQIRGFALAITPQSPSSCDQWKLPISFYMCLFGIQAQYFAPYSFTAYSNKIYMLRYGVTAADASFFSGVMNILGGLLGPLLGPVSDTYGNRALMLSAFGLFTVLGFALLATSSSISLWIPTLLFSLTYGFGDTVAYPNIRLLVGAERAGIGYGIAGLGGYGVALLVLRFAGIFMDMDDPDDPANFGVSVAWFFCGASMLAVVLWGAIHFLEGPKAAINLPSAELIETADSHIHAAALVSLNSQYGLDKLLLKKSDDEEEVADD